MAGAPKRWWGFHPGRAAIVGAAAALLLSHHSVVAQNAIDDLDSTIDAIAKDNQEAAKAQTGIQEASDAATALVERYRGVRRRTEALRTYNDQLEEELLDAQREEVESLERQIGEVTEIGRQITPLMLRMLDALEEFVELDVPFLPEERQERVAGLRKLMRRADVSESEKYRRLMEAYQVENEYGRTIEAYRGSVSVDGQDRNVDFLRIGRTVLLYRTLDGKRAGRWNQEKRAWEELPSDALKEIPKALRIARKQAAPDLVRLPVPAPTPATETKVAP